ncbi:hypothetical protein [Salipiger mangrovisoli]|uniref:DarT domain-containing protein n=1 Tax=Salipiger mangrovisoli TaxID=2865933 RepID=A0ABR9WYE2_9RHOB|nr:hypothetical protein [Salipiger mangrovisoli]MBE9636302.1 hypothetical protein [Salipiger mangrovisoli]
MTYAQNRILKFVEGSPEDKVSLPLLHTTSAYNFVDISRGEVISPSQCDVFNENLTYLFYGRPAYRTQEAIHRSLKFHWPFCFIIDPKFIDKIRAIYPFDTGAFALGLYKGFFDKKARIEDFRLPGDMTFARKLTGRFYNDAKDYLRGGTEKIENLPLIEFEAQGIQALANFPPSASLSPNSPSRDERSTSIEIQVEHEILIRDACLAIVIPEPWETELIFKDAAERWDMKDKIHTYEIDATSEQNNWVGCLNSIVRGIYKDHGII